MDSFRFLLVLIGICAFIGSPLVNAGEIDHGQYAEKAKEVIALVENAAVSFKERGKEYTVKLLNAGSGPFRNKELYVFASDMKGQSLSHPTNRELRGKSLWELKDAKGKLLVQEMIETAKNQGSGWVDYWWLRHNEKEPTLKRTYVMRVPEYEDIWVAAGYYVK